MRSYIYKLVHYKGKDLSSDTAMLVLTIISLVIDVVNVEPIKPLQAIKDI